MQTDWAELQVEVETQELHNMVPPSSISRAKLVTFPQLVDLVGVEQTFLGLEGPGAQAERNHRMEGLGVGEGMETLPVCMIGWRSHVIGLINYVID